LYLGRKDVYFYETSKKHFRAGFETPEAEAKKRVSYKKTCNY